MSVPYARVIVNPVAEGGSVRGEWPRISQRMRDAGLAFDHEFTAEAGHAIEIARQAADNGYGYLVAVGGDGRVGQQSGLPRLPVLFGWRRPFSHAFILGLIVTLCMSQPAYTDTQRDAPDQMKERGGAEQR